MSAPKFTPGPWEAGRAREDRVPVRTLDGELVAVATGQDADTDRFNARLIAAAPDLLEAAEAVLNSIGRLTLANEDLRAIVSLATAVNKARGQS